MKKERLENMEAALQRLERKLEFYKPDEKDDLNYVAICALIRIAEALEKNQGATEGR